MNEGDLMEMGGARIKLKSMTLDTREIPDYSLSKLKKARRELRNIIHDGRIPQDAHVKAMVLLNTEISIRND